MISVGKPIFKPDHVEGILGQAQTTVDQHFNLLVDRGAADVVWEADGTKLADGQTGQTHWQILFVCPKCHNVLRLDSTRKRFHVDERGCIQTDEVLRCPNPGEFGPCGWLGHIDAPKKETQVTVTTPEGRQRTLRIHGVLKDAR